MGSVENGHACWVHGHFYGILFVDSIFVITRQTTPSGFGQTAAAATLYQFSYPLLYSLSCTISFVLHYFC